MDECQARLTLKQWRLALESAGPKRGPPSSRRLDAACVSRRPWWNYRALCRVDVALEARARADIKVGLVVELEGHGWLVPARIVRILRGGSPVRCAVLPHCSRVLTRVIVMLYVVEYSASAHAFTLTLVCPLPSDPHHMATFSLSHWGTCAQKFIGNMVRSLCTITGPVLTPRFLVSSRRDCSLDAQRGSFQSAECAVFPLITRSYLARGSTFQSHCAERHI